MPFTVMLAMLDILMRYLRRAVFGEQAQSGRRTKVESTAKALTKVVGPGTCGLLVLCRYDLAGGSKPTCFKRLRILNAFEITLWQTRSTSKRADVILDLSATTPAESSKTPRHVAAKQKAYAPSTTFTRDSARFETSARIWTCTLMVSRPEKSDQPKQAGQEFGHMRRPVLGMNWGATWERSSRFPFGLDAGRRACSICPIREALASSHKHTLAARYMERVEAAALHGILVQSTVKRATGNPPDDPYSYRPHTANKYSQKKWMQKDQHRLCAMHFYLP